MIIEPKKWHTVVAVLAGLIAIGSTTLTILLRLAPFATNEAMAATEKKLSEHEIDIRVMRMTVPAIDHKVDKLDEKIESLSETWNRHIQLEHK